MNPTDSGLSATPAERSPKPETVEKYRKALELYAQTDLPASEICNITNINAKAFRAYICRYHRDLLYARNIYVTSDKKSAEEKLFGNRGEREGSQKKYQEAIETFKNNEFLHLTTAEIARKFGLRPSSLSNYLRSHYPELIKHRENERKRLGISDYRHRGVTESAKNLYSDAISHLANTDDTIAETANLFNLSLSGLRQHLLHYFPEISKEREEQRIKSASIKKSETQKQREQRKASFKYAEALSSLKKNGGSLEAVADYYGISAKVFRVYIRREDPDFWRILKKSR